MTGLLNPTLYGALCRLFPRVHINAEGERMQCKYRKRSELVFGSGRQRRGAEASDAMSMEVLESGEEYLVDCPFCDDSRQRLTINHRWGVIDRKTLSRNLHLMRCYNEECQSVASNRFWLCEEVYSDVGAQVAAARGAKVATVAPIEDARPQKLEAVNWPGNVVRLDKLAIKRPEHPALEYLIERGFDPIELGKKYQLSYCGNNSMYSLARNRIIIPFHMNGMMVGWQCRYIGDPGKDGPPRYWTMPGMLKRQIAYGFDEAIKHRTVIIVEGPLDKLNVGPQAMALLGKTLSTYLLKKLQKQLPETSTIVVMLDPNQSPKEREKGRQHHLDILTGKLRSLFPRRVARIMLPEETDPGSLDRDVMFDIIKRQAAKQGVKVYLEALQPS